MNTNVFVIWSWEHMAWWAPARAGYEESLERAGRYSYDEAADIVIGHIPAGEEVAVLLQEAQKYANGRPKVYGR